MRYTQHIIAAQSLGASGQNMQHVQWLLELLERIFKCAAILRLLL